MEAEPAVEFFEVEPIAVVDDLINSVADYVCDAADVMESVLLQHPELESKQDEIKQGVDRWQLKVQRSADRNLDKFELYVLKNVFAIPEDLEVAPPQAPDAAETAKLEAETNALWAELQRALATKRELQRKLASAENVAQLWASHRVSVQQLAAAHSESGLGNILDSAQQLNGTLQQGWQILRTAEAVGDVENACSGLAPTGPRGLHQRFSKRRTEINTVSVPDLSLLSSLLSAS